MSLDTLITHNTLARDAPDYGADACALVLMGGGARTAYQVGVLKAVGTMLAARAAAAGAQAQAFPFQWLFGTSAGALNASYLASIATQGLPALS